MYIAIAILAFGILIAIHELGHFFAAKLLDVKVNEFAIGMGPKLISKQGKETLYTLRALPFGGFCAMEDGDPENDNEGDVDPRAFSSKSRWKRIVILVSGGLANLIAAFIIILIVTSGASGFYGTTITHINEDLLGDHEHGLVVGDRFVSINGERLYYRNDILMFTQPQLARSGYVNLVIERNGDLLSINRFPLWQSEVEITWLVEGFKPNIGHHQQLMLGDIVLSANGKTITTRDDFFTLLQETNADYMDLVIRRNNEIIDLSNFPLRRHEYIVDGQLDYLYGINFTQFSVLRAITTNHIEATPGEVLRFSAYSTMNNIRLIRVSLAMLFAGEAGMRDLGGAVAIVDMMNTVGQEANNFLEALADIAVFTAFIGVNLAFINLLPIPALDGGRILLIIITWVVEKVMRRKLDPKYEAYINNGAFILLLGLMVLLIINDVTRIIGR